MNLFQLRITAGQYYLFSIKRRISENMLYFYTQINTCIERSKRNKHEIVERKRQTWYYTSDDTLYALSNLKVKICISSDVVFNY